jgi:hypothetical protein
LLRILLSTQKIWSTLKVSDYPRFEKLMSGVYSSSRNCKAFPHHKNVVCTTAFLSTHGFEVAHSRQLGELMLTFPLVSLVYVFISYSVTFRAYTQGLLLEKHWPRQQLTVTGTVIINRTTIIILRPIKIWIWHLNNLTKI